MYKSIDEIKMNFRANAYNYFLNDVGDRRFPFSRIPYPCTIHGLPT